MKNIILIALTVLFAAFNADAQTRAVSKGIKLKSDVAGKTQVQATLDTAVNTTAKSQSAYIPGFANSVSVQTDFRKISGTIGAGSKAYLEGSLTKGNAASQYEKVDSVSLANVTNQQKVFVVVPGKFVYYRVRVVGVGTHATEFKSFAVQRKY